MMAQTGAYYRRSCRRAALIVCGHQAALADVSGSRRREATNNGETGEAEVAYAQTARRKRRWLMPLSFGRSSPVAIQSALALAS